MSQDRNAIARQEFAQRSQNAAIKKARESFAGDFQLGRAGCLDRFGNMIREGDHVVFKMPNDPVMTVQAVTPSMDPNLPIGALRLVLTCEVPVLVNANQPMQGMIRIGTAQDVAAIEKRVEAQQQAAGPHNGTQQAAPDGGGNGHVQQPAETGAGDADGDVGDPGDPGDPDD